VTALKKQSYKNEEEKKKNLTLLFSSSKEQLKVRWVEGFTDIDIDRTCVICCVGGQVVIVLAYILKTTYSQQNKMDGELLGFF